MNKLKILIDDGLSILQNLTGIGFQAYNLFLSLKEKTVCHITDYSYIKPLPRFLRRFIYIVLANSSYKTIDYDVIHYQNYYVPFVKNKVKKVVTIHDLGAFICPDTIPSLYVKYNRNSIVKALSRADAVITPSISVKKEIENLFPHVNPGKIFQCNDGIRDIFWSNKIPYDLLTLRGIEPYSYSLFVGSLSPRKNLKFVLESFIKAKKEKLIPDEIKLMLCGQVWWGGKEVETLAMNEYGINSLGYLKDEEMIQFLKYSKALIFPSIYEGFGMPIIEAMALNIPIIISNIPTSIELNNKHNNQMFPFELNDVDGFISQLNRIISKHDTILENLNYGDLSEYKFSNIADEHVKVYEKLL